MKKTRGYDIAGYVDEVYTHPFEDTREERIEAALRNTNISHYRVKTIISGPIVESEIYPVWTSRRYAPPKPKRKGSSTAQKNLNEKNARKKFCRLLNANFTADDIWATFTYDKEHRPANVEHAIKEMQRYIKRLSAYCKKHGLPPLKYLYVTEYNDDEKKGDKVRVHHHLVTNFRDRDVAERLWKCGGRTNTRRLQPDDFNLEGLGHYLTKGKRRWNSSLNLAKPKVYTADSKFRSVRQVESLLNPSRAEEKLSKLYPKFIILEPPKIYANEDYGGYYIYTRMRRSE